VGPASHRLLGFPSHHDALYQQPVRLQQVLARVVACEEDPVVVVVVEKPAGVALRLLVQKTLPHPQPAPKAGLPVQHSQVAFP